MAEVILRARADAAALPLSVSSAGLLFDGRGPEQGAVWAVSKLGLDLTSHVSRTISAEILEAADLVLTMEFRQLREVVLSEGGSLERTFTLPDVAARADASPRLEGETQTDWVARLAAGRTGDDIVRADRALEVADPMGRPKRVFRRCAEEIDGQVARFVAAASPRQDSPSSPTSLRSP